MPSLIRYHTVCGVLLIAAIAVIAYAPALRGGFIWDDHLLLTDNRLIRAGDGLYRIWLTTEPIDYWPLTNSSFWLEWRLWGMNSMGYHVTNLVLHIAAALLVWTILRMLSIPGAYLAALLFAVHPMNVESVAWIAQRKNTLAMLFFLLSILCYLRQTQPPRTTDHEHRTDHWYWLSLAAFLFAMLSKGSVAVLPLLLLAITWWRHRRLTRTDLARAGPFFLIAAALTGVNVLFQTHGADAIRSIAFAERLTGAGAALWFYLSKTLLPINLVFVYPRWHVELSAALWWLPLLAALAFTITLIRQRDSPNWGRHLLFAWGFFCVALLPVLGFTDVYFMKFSQVADHYAYIALVAVAALVAAGWSAWVHSPQAFVRSSAAITAAIVVGALTLLTMQQSSLYADALTLYQHTLEKNPDCWMARNNLGKEMLDSGRPLEAIAQFEDALRRQPNFPEAQFNLSLALAKVGRLTEAIEQCQLALQTKSDFPEARCNLGRLLSEAGQLPQAIEQLNEAVRLRPDHAEAHYLLGLVLTKAGNLLDAIQHYQQAVQLAPDYVEAHNNLANALNSAGRPQEALEHFEIALRLSPNSAVIHYNLGLTLSAIGRTPEAIAQYQTALKLAQAAGQAALAQQIEARIKADHEQQSP